MTDVSMLNETLSRISEKLDVCVHRNSVNVAAIVLGILLGLLITIILVYIILYNFIKKNKKNKVAGQ